jgi:hypothetical protein
VELPDRLRWLTSGRFWRPVSALGGTVVLAAVLYNATVIDRVPPSVSIRLSDAAPNGNALTMSSVHLVFNEEVQHETAEKAFSITPEVQGTFHWQGSTLIFTPSQKLPLASTFHVHLASGVKDRVGNVQTDAYDLTFTTVGKPVVSSVSPVADAQAVPLDAQITITFDRNMSTQTVLDDLTIEPETTCRSTWKGQVLTLTPEQPLRPSTGYTLKLGGTAADLDGNALVPYEWSFQTVALGLTARQLVPAPDSQGVSVRTPIAVIFDGPVDPLSATGAIQVTAGETAVAGTIETISLPSDSGPAAWPTPTQSDAGPNVIVFTPDRPLQADTTYSVTMNSAVRRTDGRATAAQSWTFSTGEPPASAIGRVLFLSDRSGVSNLWMVNPDGTGLRQLTAELAAVTAFDVNTAGDRIAYAVAGQVVRMNVNGTNVQRTAGGLREYAPAFTPDGTGLVVARRDGNGADLGFHRIPLITGTDERQVLVDGAPELGSDQIGDEGLPAALELPAWGLREAFSDDQDGTTWMLVARGDGNALELVDMAGLGVGRPPLMVGLTAKSRPVWNLVDRSFYAVASDDGGLTWGYWRIATDGTKTRLGPAVGDIAASSTGALAFVAAGVDGVDHLFFASSGATEAYPITSQTAWTERSPWFSPDGQQVIFLRLDAHNSAQTGGIWIMRPGDIAPTLLSQDGICPRFVP